MVWASEIYDAERGRHQLQKLTYKSEWVMGKKQYESEKSKRGKE